MRGETSAATIVVQSKASSHGTTCQVLLLAQELEVRDCWLVTEGTVAGLAASLPQLRSAVFGASQLPTRRPEEPPPPSIAAHPSQASPEFGQFRQVLVHGVPARVGPSSLVDVHSAAGGRGPASPPHVLQQYDQRFRYDTQHLLRLRASSAVGVSEDGTDLEVELRRALPEDLLKQAEA
jgi:hypothetical protein